MNPHSPTEARIDQTWLTPQYRVDLRTTPPDVFVDETYLDFTKLSWKQIGRPYQVNNYSRDRRKWEESRHERMPVLVQWQHFNRAFHELFSYDLPNRLQETSQRLKSDPFPAELREHLEDWLQVRIWNRVHRVEDAVWDPRGKRALFAGLDLVRPRILFLGAAEGYEAMQLLAMYPGGEAVLVDFDQFCRDERFGNFPDEYPFLGTNVATGHPEIYHRSDFQIQFLVEDIAKLHFGREFDVVISVGLLEHFPDDLKPMVLQWHRQFVKPNGYIIMTTPRLQWRSKLFYLAMGTIMNYGYRELMETRQLGLYAFENGMTPKRLGRIKAHNGFIGVAR